jgi:hypothetical protein
MYRLLEAQYPLFRALLAQRGPEEGAPGALQGLLTYIAAGDRHDGPPGARAGLIKAVRRPVSS